MDEKKIRNFDLSSDNIKIMKMLENDLLPIHINAISSALPNENDSNFPKEAQELSLPSWDNKPILGYFGASPRDILTGDKPDFHAHNGGNVKHDSELDMDYYDYSNPTDEKAIGLIIPGSAKVVYHEDDGLWWTECDALIWCKYNHEAVKNLLKSKQKTISVEVEVYDSHEDENGYEINEKYTLMGITILGDKIAPGIKNAHLTVSSFSKTERFKKEMKMLSFACNPKLNKSNKKQVQNTNVYQTNQNNKTNKAIDFLKEFSQLVTKFDNFNDSEDNIYHTNHPVSPENEGWEEITFDDDDIDKDDINDDNKSNDESKNLEEDSQKKTNARKEMSLSMTYNVKRQLLDSALSEAIANAYPGDNKPYAWVNDFDDETVYFYLDDAAEEGHFCAKYTITMSSTEEDKVESCVIDFANKERCVQTWKKYSDESQEETENKTNMENFEKKTQEVENPVSKTFADDRGTEAPKSGDDRGVPATHSGAEDTATPHTPATYEENSEKQEEAKDDTEVKSVPAGGNKEVTEVVKAAKEEPEEKKEKPEEKKEESKEKKETEACDGKEDCACGNKIEEACEEKQTESDKNKAEECNFEAKFTQLSADYVAMQKENETLKSVNAKFEADIADLMAKVASFEAENTKRHNNDMYTFGANLISAESDLTEDCRKTMSEELKTECEASKFASEDEVKKFTITKIAMALYENRKVNQSKEVKTESKKKDEFVQSIVKPEAQVSKLTQARKALEALDEED